MAHRYLVTLLAVGCLREAGAADSLPLDPERERASFRFADSNLTAELVVAEPLVRSPVALAWDADGRLFVAEMRDYPNAADGGAIRRLEDRDGDGRYETATLFADHLPFPNSVLPWNGGVLVTAAPDLWFLRDSDGDGVAEERRVLFTGFGTGNQQLRVNGLFWGLDGWVYGANGRSDGAVRRVYEPQAIAGNQASRDRSLMTNAVSLRGRDFRFRPDTGEFETLAGRSQFGHTRDDWGNRFLSWNTIPLRHEVFPDRHLAAHAGLAAVEVVQDCLPVGDAGDVFPLTPAPLVFNNESGSHFNALSGLHIFRGDALGAAYAGNAFVGESLRNLVHRRVLVPEGPTFRAERGDVGREFLASTDPWFHPVNFATGPDGALYVADFYRQFVEHPDWVAKEMRERVRWEAGREYGRIWRIRSTSAGGVKKPSPMARLVVGDLVRELASPNGWRRDTAQRLLAERRDPGAVPELHIAARSGLTAQARVAAWFLLEFYGQTDREGLTNALRDSAAPVRAAAATLTGRQLALSPGSSNGGSPDTAAWIRGLTALLRDSSDTVRLSAALALCAVSNIGDREPPLQALAASTTNRWLRLAAAAGSPAVAASLAARANGPSQPKLNRSPPAPRNPDPDRERVVNSFRPALQLAGDRTRGAAICARLCLACHYLQGQGQRVGPDLGGLGTRPVETLLTDVLDPSRQVAPDYQAYEVITDDDTHLTGLIASESETRLTVRLPGSPDVSVAKNQVRELRATGRSLMPDGLEAGLSGADFADLLAFLRAPDGELLPR